MMLYPVVYGTGQTLDIIAAMAKILYLVWVQMNLIPRIPYNVVRTLWSYISVIERFCEMASIYHVTLADIVIYGTEKVPLVTISMFETK